MAEIPRWCILPKLLGLGLSPEFHITGGSHGQGPMLVIIMACAHHRWDGCMGTSQVGGLHGHVTGGMDAWAHHSSERPGRAPKIRQA
jgi:hypothetical protein